MLISFLFSDQLRAETLGQNLNTGQGSPAAQFAELARLKSEPESEPSESNTAVRSTAAQCRHDSAKCTGDVNIGWATILEAKLALDRAEAATAALQNQMEKAFRTISPSSDGTDHIPFARLRRALDHERYAKLRGKNHGDA